MSARLNDPELPPGAIFKTYGDGGALRNDGVKLTPASKNPWYVLATVAGEQEGTQALYIDDELHARNRRFWNGWMCRGMCDSERLELAKHMGLSEAELSPLSEVEVQQLSERFQLAFDSTPPVEVVPKADESARFSSTYFPKAFSLERCFFVESAFFDAAHFAGGVDFSAAHFSKAVYLSKVYFAENALSKETHFASGASFLEAYFVGKADFHSAYFGKEAFFPKATFEGAADFAAAQMLEGTTFFDVRFGGNASFERTYFAGDAYFRKAHFTDHAGFEAAHFGGSVNFSDGIFNGKTDFGGAVFKGAVPEFFQRVMHHKTIFNENPLGWPKETAGNVEKGRKAYTRLRQIAAEIYDPDLEHFFLRQEMRCKARIDWEKGAWFHWLLFSIYRCLADSGISVARPFWLLVFFWAFGFACFAGHFDSGVLADLPPDIQDSRYGAAAGVSFGNLFGFLGINRLYFTDLLRDHIPDGLQFVAGLQTVAGVVLLFFLGLGLRNRFRLK